MLRGAAAWPDPAVDQAIESALEIGLTSIAWSSTMPCNAPIRGRFVVWHLHRNAIAMPKLMLVPLLLVGLSLPSFAAEQASIPKWLLGIWELTDDPDHSPTDWMEFRADGTFVNTLVDCRKVAGTFHLFRGDIYLAIEQNGKFLANGSRPNQEKTKLLYTSPRTRNTATYEKVASVECHGG